MDWGSDKFGATNPCGLGQLLKDLVTQRMIGRRPVFVLVLSLEKIKAVHSSQKYWEILH